MFDNKNNTLTAHTSHTFAISVAGIEMYIYFGSIWHA